MDLLRRKYLSLINLLTSSFNKKLTILFLLGLILIGFGVLSYKTDIFLSGDKVEVITPTTEPQNTNNEIVVEISGAVEKEGVYKMKNGERVEDLLIISGGLSSDADRDWVTKNINRASKLFDGQKIYIYHSGDTSARQTVGIKVDQPVLGLESQNNENLVNINTASQSELEKLVGIGPVYAQKITEHRPYSSLEELVTKGAISQKVLEKIKTSISL